MLVFNPFGIYFCAYQSFDRSVKLPLQLNNYLIHRFKNCSVSWYCFSVVTLYMALVKQFPLLILFMRYLSLSRTCDLNASWVTGGD